MTVYSDADLAELSHGLTADDLCLSAFTMQCDTCAFWHVYMNWPPSCEWTKNSLNDEEWYIPRLVFDSQREAHYWLDTQADAWITRCGEPLQ